ncbi:MAG: two-component regulator propeller domain-containing protein [Bacteroidota bacterium]
MDPLFKVLLLLLLLSLVACTSTNQPITLAAQEVIRPTDQKYGAGDIVSDGLLDSKGDLWITTSNEGVFKYDGKQFTQITEKEGLCSKAVSTILEDEQGTLWFGTANGICRFNGQDFTTIPLPREDSLDVSPKTGFPSRQPKEVTCMILDKQGSLWIGTDAAGAYRYQEETFTSFLKFAGRLQPDNKYNNCITSILDDRQGNIWFTSMTHGAIEKYDGESMTHFDVDDGLLGDMITTSYLDSKGNIWFGSIQNLEGGISVYDGQKFTNYTVKDGLCDSNVTSFYEDQDGLLWISTGDGVCSFDGETFSELLQDGQSVGDIRFFVKDQAGQLWFGGRYGILWRYDGEQVQDFTYAKRAN